MHENKFLKNALKDLEHKYEKLLSSKTEV